MPNWTPECCLSLVWESLSQLADVDVVPDETNERASPARLTKDTTPLRRAINPCDAVMACWVHEPRTIPVNFKVAATAQEIGPKYLGCEAAVALASERPRIQGMRIVLLLRPYLTECQHTFASSCLLAFDNRIQMFWRRVDCVS